MQPDSGQAQQHDAEGRLAFNLTGDLPGGGTHHSRSAATQPLVGLEFLP